MLRKNTVRLENAKGNTVHAFSTGKNIIFTVGHFFHGMVDGDELNIVRLGVKIKTIFESKRLRVYKRDKDSRDLAAYAIPYQNIPLFRDLKPHIVSTTALNSFVSTNGSLVAIETEFMLPRIQWTTRIYEHLDGLFAVEDGLEYPGHRGVKGQCGLPIVGNFSTNWNDNSLRKVMAIHTGAYGNCGYSEMLTDCEVDDAYTELKEFTVPFEPHRVASVAHCSEGEVTKTKWLHDEIETKQIWAIGNVPVAARLPAKHRYTRSPMAGEIAKPVTDNSVLSPFDERLDEIEKGKSILLKAHAKVANEKEPLPPDVLNDFVEKKSADFRNLFSDRLMRVLTWDESINGILGDPFIEKLNMSTSAGFGFSSPKSRGKKHLFIEDEPNHFVPTAEFQILLDEFWNDLMSGKSLQHVWKATLKTERRKFEKIRLGKTRQFNVSQVIRILASRRLNLCFNAAFLATRFKHEGAAGINCFSPEWDVLAQKLLKNGDKMFDLDYENFDGTTPPEALFLHPLIANKVYCDAIEFRNARIALTHEVAFRFEIVGDVVYQTFGGNPSGDDNTTIRNSLVGAFYLYMCWIYLAPPWMKSYSAFNQHVASAIVGDDNVVSVSDKAAEFYVPERICHVLSDFNLKATSASDATGVVGKVAGAVTFKNLNSCVFLKCGFARRNDVDYTRVLPLMDENTINELTNWVAVGLNPEDACLENCNTALRMKFFYGRQMFNDFREKLKIGWKRQCIMPASFHTFDELLFLWRNEQFQAFPQTSPAFDAPIVLE
jgi:hypothetical protein